MKKAELIDDLLDMIQEQQAMLEQVEWHQPRYNGSPACPCCGNQQHWGHDPECELAKLIGAPIPKECYQ